MRGPHTVLKRALLRHAGVGSPCGRDPRGSSSSCIPPPPPCRGPFWGGGGGGVPSAPGGRRAAPVASELGGGAGGGTGVRPPAPPPRQASACFPLSPACPPGVYSRRGILPGGRGRRARSGRLPTVQCGGGGGGGEGNPPALVRAPVFPGPASDKAAPFAPCWAPPVRRRPAAGRACGRLPWPWCPRTPGAAASSGGVRGRRFFGLPPSALGPEWEGGRGVGGALWSPGAAFFFFALWLPAIRVGPPDMAPPPDGRGGGGGGMAVPAPGASHRLRGRPLPLPPST